MNKTARTLVASFNLNTAPRSFDVFREDLERVRLFGVAEKGRNSSSNNPFDYSPLPANTMIAIGTVGSDPVATLGSWSEVTPDPVTAVITQIGSATQSCVQRITVSEFVYSGSFALTLDDETAGPINYSADAATIQTLLRAAFAGYPDLLVTNVALGQWDIDFVELEAVEELEPNGAGLDQPHYLLGYIDLNTEEVGEFLGAASSKAATFEIQVIEGGEKATYQLSCTVKKDLINDDAILSPVRLLNYYVENGLARGITSIYGGTSADLDSLATNGLEVGRTMMIWDSVAGAERYGFGIWELVEGTAAENPAAGIVRPDDYAASTNEKNWVRRI